SRMVRNEIVNHYGYSGKRIDIIYNGVPVDEFRRGSAQRDQSRRSLGIAESETVLLFVGSGWTRKGLRFAVDAMTNVTDLNLRLLVAGRGSKRKFQSPRIQFLGEVADVRPIYAATDIFILPTLYDPFSNACLEALALDLPVITTRANGFAEVIENGVHGSIIDSADNVGAISDAIRFWADEDRRKNARSTIFARAAEFDISRNVEQTLAVIDQAASAAPASG
ncbi:MAG: glycosyltransferase family 4 protein, partial [Verrucomicrobiaceae bacterium]|nr:glycosyltransferase family 4 protein [Verrucomicrobiaceae bacterium]